MKHAVTAASGKLGRLVVDDLLAHLPAEEIVVLVRDPARVDDLARAGVEVRTGDYDDPAGLRVALEQVDVVLLISSWDIGRRVQQHENLIHAAQEVGVERIVYSSVLDWGDDSPVIREHQATEVMLQQCGSSWTILRNQLFIEPYEIEVELAARTGRYRTTVAGTGAAFITRADIARCASVVLRENSHADMVYGLTGPGVVTPEDFASVAAKLRGEPVVVEEITRDVLRADYEARGMSGAELELSLGLEDAIRGGALALVTDDVERLLGKPGTGFREHMLAEVAPRLAARAD